MSPHVNTDPAAERGDTAGVIITLTQTDDSRRTCTADTKMAECTVTVGRPDLVISGLGEDDEEDPGVVIRFNNDDDDVNRELDYAQYEVGHIPVSGENDLIPMTLDSGGVRTDCGRLTLTYGAFWPYCAEVRVWTTPEKTELVPTGTYWEPPSPWPTTLWVEGVSVSCPLRDVWIALTYSDTVGECACDPPQCSCSDTVRLTVADANLTLHDGLAPNDGGQPVSDPNELSRGAFTVANLNDTDNDQRDPNDPNNLSLIGADANDDYVTVTDPNHPGGAGGRDELDLMKLLIDRPCPVIPDAELDVIVRRGTAKFWRTSHKGSAFPNGTTTLHYESFEVSDPNWPREVWVELPAASASLRDVEIVSQYAGLQEIDVVKATGIWISAIESKHDAGNTSWGDISDPPASILADYGGYGLAPIVSYPYDKGVHNVIVMRFQLAPAGVWNERVVHFDTTRCEEWVDWRRTADGVVADGAPYPDNVEYSNDVSAYDSEDPSSLGGFFAFDAPGPLSAFNLAKLRRVFRANFGEFCRVGFGERPSGALSGSRCSHYYQWNSWHRLVPDGALWKRSTGDDPETNDNHVWDGRSVLGDEPPFP
jgi:hypothetical protein